MSSLYYLLQKKKSMSYLEPIIQKNLILDTLQGRKALRQIHLRFWHSHIYYIFWNICSYINGTEYNHLTPTDYELS